MLVKINLKGLVKTYTTSEVRRPPPSPPQNKTLYSYQNVMICNNLALIYLFCVVDNIVRSGARVQLRVEII